MSAAAECAPRFVRRTVLNDNEYRVNFKQIDNDVIAALVSPEARKVTPLMPAIYLGLLATSAPCWERDGVLHFVGEDREGGRLTAWEQMREIAGVANSTLSKAMEWMHKTGVIGYDARANGVGIRIFFNRASSSIRPKMQQKNLRLVPTPSGNVPTPSNGTRFKEHDSEINRENNMDPRASAREENHLCKEPSASPSKITSTTSIPNIQEHQTCLDIPNTKLISLLAKQITIELRPEIAAVVKRETDGTREWFLKYGVPKATRVAQHETYDLLRAHGIISKKTRNSTHTGQHIAVEEKEREGKSEKITSYLAETSIALRQVAANASIQGETILHAACLSADRELNKLHDLIIAGEQLEILEIDNRLTAIENGITEAMWETAEATDREAMLKSARIQLRDYEARMEREVFEETIHRRVSAILRDQRGIPHISLFYT
ncbi:MAG: hypothetical protein L0226_16700 [Acidobacteria bacterium]|nr:hypothetical protein [Acidobacteriota bacterium]